MKEPEQFSNSELVDLASTWPLYQDIELPDRATVVVAGAYKGKLMEFMLEAFPQIHEIHGFEPAEWAWQHAAGRNVKLKHDNPDKTIKTWRFGLLADRSTDIRELPMYEFETDAQSLIENTAPEHADKPKGTGRFLGVEAALSLFDTDISLMILNMEGYEWRLLPWLFDHHLLGRIKSLAVQFHAYALYQVSTPDRLAIRPILDDVYGKPVVDEYPQWVYWRRSNT